MDTKSFFDGFSTKTTLFYHLSQYHSEYAIKCHLCQYKAFEKKLFDIHFRTNHAKNEFGCSYNGCKQSFKLKTSLEIHLNLVHLNSKPFKCEQYFAANNLLLRHLYKRHYSFGFKCDLCQYYCKDNSLLVKDQLIHTTEKPFKSVIDGREKIFKPDNYLRSNRLYLHTNQMRFVCDWP
jgi:Pyruvate/2-oxoacid:ferredoxin oxidoreductase delta subunit